MDEQPICLAHSIGLPLFSLNCKVFRFIRESSIQPRIQQSRGQALKNSRTTQGGPLELGTLVLLLPLFHLLLTLFHLQIGGF